MRSFREFIADSMRIPKDVAMDLPRISVCGSKEIYIENHKGLCEYTNDDIRIKMNDGIIHINGSKLRIIEMEFNYMVINGLFYSINYENSERNKKNVQKNL